MVNRSLDQLNYRSLLRGELERRCQRNPKYSLRSFARDLVIAPARLSDVLRGRYGISRKAARQIAQRLSWSSDESRHFCDLVESEHARSPRAKAAARERLKERPRTFHQLALDTYQVISDWYHFPIIETMRLANFESNSTWIAKRLGISVNLVDSAIERLMRLGLVECEGQLWKPTGDFVASPSGIPSEAIRNSHRQMLEKAIAAIELQSIEERDISSVILAVDVACMDEAKEFIKKFRRRFDANFGSAAKTKKGAVYCLGIQLFRIDQKAK